MFSLFPRENTCFEQNKSKFNSKISAQYQAPVDMGQGAQQPQVSNQTPQVSNQTPQTSDQYPQTSNQVPQTSDQVSYLSFA